ncbi:hypothetical protein PAPHI01_0980 [Pancytospora philotis]|nr:hypothetical protein PAPHI01_0980 [Pancytospora philotis]
MKESNAQANMDRLLQERRRLKTEIVTLENDIFKLEGSYQEMVSGTPITKSIEYYLNNKVERKKTPVVDAQRVFSTDFPKPKEKRH